MTKVLFAVVVLHIVAALKHHYIDSDGVLGRMASKFGWLVFIVTIALVLGVFGRLGSPSADRSNAVESVNHGSVEKSRITEDTDVNKLNKTPSVSELPVWDINYQRSYITFTADQAGAPFDGVWEQWQAVMQFDPSQLDKSAFHVTIDTTQVNSKDQERDGYIVGSEFFDTTVFKTATFIAQEFEAQSNSEFTSQGQLSIKGLSKSVLFTFNVTQQGDLVELIGSASIDRLAWNIGTGDWTDTSWVGQQVEVSVKVVATLNK